MVKDLQGDPLGLELMSPIHERVLVVEDERGVRELAERVLRKHGYEVFPCRDLQETFSLYEEEGGRFDLLISDVVLPDGNGVELAARLRKQDPALAVLLTSGYNEILSKWEPFQKLRAPLLQKPFRVLDLLQSVRQALDQEKNPVLGNRFEPRLED